MIKLKKKELDFLWGFASGKSYDILSNGEKGYSYDKSKNETTIVMCCSNCGDYSRATFNGKII
jgi:hypothetical protein